jgi:hypothetical protein
MQPVSDVAAPRRHHRPATTRDHLIHLPGQHRPAPKTMWNVPHEPVIRSSSTPPARTHTDADSG